MKEHSFILIEQQGGSIVELKERFSEDFTSLLITT